MTLGVGVCPYALPMGLEPNILLQDGGMGVCRVAAICGVRLRNTAGYARTWRRWCMCKQGSFTIDHVLWHLRWRGRVAGPGKVVSASTVISVPARCQDWHDNQGPGRGDRGGRVRDVPLQIMCCIRAGLSGNVTRCVGPSPG